MLFILAFLLFMSAVNEEKKIGDCKIVGTGVLISP